MDLFLMVRPLAAMEQKITTLWIPNSSPLTMEHVKLILLVLLCLFLFIVKIFKVLCHPFSHILR